MQTHRTNSLIMAAFVILGVVAPRSGGASPSDSYSPDEDIQLMDLLRLNFNRLKMEGNPSSRSTLANLVQIIDTSSFSPPSPDPMGIAYLPSMDSIFMSDSEVNETPLFRGDNVFTMDRFGNLTRTFSTTDYSNEPTGLAYNPSNGHLYICDDDRDEVYEIDPGSDGRFGTHDDRLTTFDTRAFDSFDPEGITYDPAAGVLYIADGDNAEIYRVSPGSNGRFDGVAPLGDDQVTHFDTRVFGVTDPEGLAFDIGQESIYVVGRPSNFVGHITSSGSLIESIDLSFLNATRLSGVALAPGSAGSGALSLYLTDRGIDNNANPNENDGLIYEVALTAAPPGEGEINVRVSRSDDDAEESPTGTMSRSSSDLELVFDRGNQLVGIRFQDVNIPRGARIDRAHVQFQVDERKSGTIALSIRAHDTNDAPGFTSQSGNISSRPLTSASVSWSPPAWQVRGEVGPNQRTPDLSSLIQEIVNRSGWSPGNAIVLVISGTGERVTESYDGDSGGAPLLHVEFDDGGD